MPESAARREEYDNFYTTYNLDKNRILQIMGDIIGEEKGYICVCFFCKFFLKCDRSCCKTGIPCISFEIQPETEAIFKVIG